MSLALSRNYRAMFWLFALQAVTGLGIPQIVAHEVQRRVLNNGQLVLEDIPEIPAELAESLNRYQQVRGATFQDWTADGHGIYIATRFAEVPQLHRVDHAGGARHQLTFFSEPLGAVSRQPATDQLLLGLDHGGNENSQIHLFDAAQGSLKRLTSGQHRHTSAVWQRSGQRFAFQSTQRNGRSNDVWSIDPASPDSAQMVWQSPDGSWWAPLDWDKAGRRLLLQQYVSANDSRIHLLDLNTGQAQLLLGGTTPPHRNAGQASACWTAEEEGLLVITDQQSDYAQLAYVPLSDPSQVQPITQAIPWDVEALVLNPDRTLGAFVVNADGLGPLYLLDVATRRYTQVESLPAGLLGAMGFSPDGRRLALTLNSAQTSSDVYTFDIDAAAVSAQGLQRWTFSEVGGLDTRRFRIPELIHYPTFDSIPAAPDLSESTGAKRTIPAFVYRPEAPAGGGKYPVIIFIHGGPESQFRPGFLSLFQAWIDQLGVAVIAPNVRGSSGYGSGYLQLDNGFRREDSVKDIGALLDWIALQPDLDASRVAVYGGSYGGYMVLASCVHYSHRLRAAVDIVGISNFVTFLENTEEYRRDLRRVEYGDERDAAMRTFLQQISPLNHVEAIQVPLFVVQGQNDPRVPVSEAEQMVAALRAQHRPVWYMNALNEGHGYQKKENRDLFGQAAVLFFQTFLLPPKPASTN